MLSIGEKGSERKLAKPPQLSPLGLYNTVQNLSPRSKKKLDDYAQVSPTARLKQMFKESSSFANKVNRASKSCFESVTLPAVGGRMSQKSRVSVGEFGRQLLVPSTIQKYKDLDFSLAMSRFNDAIRASPQKPILTMAARRRESLPMPQLTIKQ